MNKSRLLVASGFAIILFFLVGCSKSKDSSSSTPSCTTPPSPVVTDTLSILIGDTIKLTAGNVSGATSYQWTGPNGFNSSDQNPQIIHAAFIDSGLYSVKVNVGSCTSNPATTTVKVNMPVLPCAPFTNQVNLTAVPAISFSPLPFEFGVGPSGNYEVSCSGSNGDVHITFAIPTKPQQGLYRLTSLGPLAQADEAELTVTASSAFWQVSSANSYLYVYSVGGKLKFEFCNLSFSNSTFGTTSNGCFGNITEP